MRWPCLKVPSPHPTGLLRTFLPLNVFLSELVHPANTCRPSQVPRRPPSSRTDREPQREAPPGQVVSRGKRFQSRACPADWGTHPGLLDSPGARSGETDKNIVVKTQTLLLKPPSSASGVAHGVGNDCPGPSRVSRASPGLRTLPTPRTAGPRPPTRLHGPPTPASEGPGRQQMPAAEAPSACGAPPSRRPGAGQGLSRPGTLTHRPPSPHPGSAERDPSARDDSNGPPLRPRPSFFREEAGRRAVRPPRADAGAAIFPPGGSGLTTLPGGQ
ncbi:hypothetical protein J1605_000631 [Eschrichtius robustus]|uniref:Basic proline-rich protein-like n=1 Tax=Eschrichtius robustus TaxID=9764 RepID=A0AB34GKL4_ESCRO|nr:hypothetical protein J1605_000631 [Eschrichtius robustus]